MNAVLQLRLGLGDIVAAHFHCRRSSRALTAMLAGFRDGSIDRIGVTYDEGTRRVFNVGLVELFAAIGVPYRQPRDVAGWTAAESLVGPDDPIDPVPVPTQRPAGAVPRRLVLLCQHAGADDRCLDDPSVYRAVKDAVPGTVVVRVGRTMVERAKAHATLAAIPCDLDLLDRTTAAQTAWLAKRAVAVVAPASWLRTMTWAFGVPVFELLQEGRAEGKTIERTAREYAAREYGINELNHWMPWPSGRGELTHLLREYARGRDTQGTRPAGGDGPLPPLPQG